MPAVSVFFTGATGLQGASVLQLICKNPKYDITALVRSEEKAKKVRELAGVKTLVGSLEDAELMTSTAAKHDVVVQIADIFNLPGTAALLAGAKRRFEVTGRAPIHIHTSGTGIWADLGAAGNAPSGKITKDNDHDLTAHFNGLPHNAPATAVVEAGKAGYVKTYTVYPPTVWGAPSGPFFESGLAHVGSIQLPLSIKTSIARGQGGIVGDGLNVWNHAHIADVADFFALLLSKAVDGFAPSGPFDGHYIVENGEYQYKKFAQTYTKALHAKGKSASPEPTKFEDQEFQAIGFLFILGTNATCEGPRARSLGWKPKYTTDDFYAWIPREVDAAIAGTLAGGAY
ncbi:NAD(P)-binding protein [Peniophora sp. CONT]|nr:NAD(P)-binding protein [Peniophora sp. CONT]